MAVFTYIADFGATAEYDPRVRVARFGDGYEQRVADGVNPMAEAWALTFAVRTDSEAAGIVGFLAARGGFEAFDWTRPDGVSIRVVCRKWNRTLDRYNMNTVTARFERVYEPV